MTEESYEKKYRDRMDDLLCKFRTHAEQMRYVTDRVIKVNNNAIFMLNIVAKRLDPENPQNSEWLDMTKRVSRELIDTAIDGNELIHFFMGHVQEVLEINIENIEAIQEHLENMED